MLSIVGIMAAAVSDDARPKSGAAPLYPWAMYFWPSNVAMAGADGLASRPGNTVDNSCRPSRSSNPDGIAHWRVRIMV